MNSSSISSSPIFNLLKKSIPLYSPNKLITTPHSPHTHLNIAPRPLAMSTTPPEFPSRRTPEVDPSIPAEMPPIPSKPDEFIVAPEPEIQPPISPPDPTPNPPGPEIPHPPNPSPPGPDVFPPPEVPPRQPPDVVPPNAPEIFPPPSTPIPDIIPPTGPMVVL